MIGGERHADDGGCRVIDLPSGARVHYADVGTGETLLFLHGNPAWSFQRRDLIGGLRGSFRCVALDYPGFGLSSAPPGYGFTTREQSHALEEFVDRLGLHDLTPVMQDWGGPIGLGLAGRRPQLVRRLVLGNTYAWPTSTSEPRGMFSKIAGGPIGEFVQRRPSIRDRSQPPRSTWRRWKTIELADANSFFFECEVPFPQPRAYVS